ncbi:MAG: hypothetical protein WDO14_00065 [Bacteroidota bacterium]
MRSSSFFSAHKEGMVEFDINTSNLRCDLYGDGSITPVTVKLPHELGAERVSSSSIGNARLRLEKSTVLPIGSSLPNNFFATSAVMMIDRGESRAVSLLPFTSSKSKILKNEGSVK